MYARKRKPEDEIYDSPLSHQSMMVACSKLGPYSCQSCMAKHDSDFFNSGQCKHPMKITICMGCHEHSPCIDKKLPTDSIQQIASREGVLRFPEQKRCKKLQLWQECEEKNNTIEM